MIRRPTRATRSYTLFPYTTFSDLGEGVGAVTVAVERVLRLVGLVEAQLGAQAELDAVLAVDREAAVGIAAAEDHLVGDVLVEKDSRIGGACRDRKSTRLTTVTNAQLVCRLRHENTTK